MQVNPGPDHANLSRLDAAMAVASLLALAAAVPVAVYGAGLLARRLGHVAETAARISAGDLDFRSGPTKGDDEVADIAATVDRMADTLAQRLRTERRFTADVARELRTPVGGLLAAADLLPPGETEDLLRARIRDLRGLVEDLLEISRLDAGADRPVRARVPLAAAVTEAVARTGLETEVESWAVAYRGLLQRVWVCGVGAGAGGRSSSATTAWCSSSRTGRVPGRRWGRRRAGGR
ncbi:HAMP domain-containing protein [Streptomyces sp. NPDC085466]|uniref:ATP-binding protein n=1 Tax=Streptomyces sp. NPDC085466 TaxID=3365725 RepID=UPI0037CE3619